MKDKPLYTVAGLLALAGTVLLFALESKLIGLLVLVVALFLSAKLSKDAKKQGAAPDKKGKKGRK